jgi:hypothetical protein
MKLKFKCQNNMSTSQGTRGLSQCRCRFDARPILFRLLVEKGHVWRAQERVFRLLVEKGHVWREQERIFRLLVEKGHVWRAQDRVFRLLVEKGHVWRAQDRVLSECFAIPPSPYFYQISVSVPPHLLRVTS